jgi:RNA polymerase sigma-70 factor, ECF subfamily
MPTPIYIDSVSPDADTFQMIESLQRGENQGYEILCDRYAGLLFGVITRLVTDEVDAENLLQDCFVKIWRSIDSFDANKGRFATWLINIARNTAIDFTRSKYYAQRRKNQPIENLVSSETHVSDMPIATDSIGLKQIVNNLPKPYQEIIDWIYFQGYTQQEIADEFQIPLGTVKTRTRAALQALRKHFV